MVFTRNQPVASDDLDISQPFLVNNTNGSDDSFGIDHYKFSDLTANNGFHNKVTTPGYVTTPPTVPVAPPTTTTNPIFYGFNPLDAGGVATTSLGLLQYSRGPSNAVPTPVTAIQSPSTPTIILSTQTTNVLDFTGITVLAVATLYAEDMVRNAFNVVDVLWNGTTFTFLNNTLVLQAVSTGNILKIKNNDGAAYNNVFWTLKFHRIQV